MTIGVDVSKDSLAAATSDAYIGNYPNTKAAITKLLAKLEPDTIVAMEATGSYHRALADTAYEQGFLVLVFNPKDAQRFANSLSPRAKTDKADARAIALFASARHHRPYKPLPAFAQTIRDLVRARCGLVVQRVSCRNQAQANPGIRDCLSQAIKGLNSSIKELDKQITDLARRHPRFSLLCAIPGFGELVSAYILAMLMSGEFTRSDSFVAFLRLDIKVKQSGKKAGQPCLTKRGDPQARRLLYLAARAAVRKPGPLQDLYNRHLARGFSKTQAAVIVARKLARIAWAIYTTGNPYNPHRVLKQCVVVIADHYNTLAAQPSAKATADPPNSLHYHQQRKNLRKLPMT